MSESVDRPTYDAFVKELQKDGFMQKENLNELLQNTSDMTVKQMLEHKECGNENCGMCNMKRQIDKDAFIRGAKNGIKMGQKFPNADFGVDK